MCQSNGPAFWVETPLSKIPMRFVDVRVQLDQYEKWVKLYSELFAGKSK